MTSAAQARGVGLAIDVHIQDGWTVVALTGDVDVATSFAMRAAIGHDWIGRGVVVDLTGVAFIDSTGLGDLLISREQVMRQKGAFRIVTRGALMQRVLQITGLDEVFDIADTLARALI